MNPLCPATNEQPTLLHNHARYDGDGNRVEKSNGRLFWYGAGTEILDESDLTGSITLEMVYFGGKRVAHRTSSNVIYYYEGDMLGSARTIVQAGLTSPCYDADFLPFGGERVITNTCTQNYKFEGKKRDNETGNDDFGARFYRSNIGRWMSADWSSVPAPVPYANLTNPQTLNLYAMVSDNPETFADLDGHCGTGGLPGANTSIQPCQNGSTHALQGEGYDEGNSGIASTECSMVSCETAAEESAQETEVAAQQAANANAHAAQQKDEWVNPTGDKVRGCDAGGCGNYGAPRNEGLGATHEGTDYVARPGQDVLAVHDGTVSRVGYAYKGDTRLRTVDIRTANGYTIKELYVAPSSGLKAGTKVSAGQVIGTAQDIRVRTGPQVTPHIHITILHGGNHVNPETLIPIP